MVKNNKVLVLNNDRVPLSTICWKKAIKKIYSEGRDSSFVIEYYDEWIRDSKGSEYAIPAVICNKYHVVRNYTKIAFSKNNVFRRDGFCCQYCMKTFSKENLTIDHVVPRSKWTHFESCSSWNNVVAACKKCNSKKADRTPEEAGMQLRKLFNRQIINYKRPSKPDYIGLVLGNSHVDERNIPDEWSVYIDCLIKK